MDSIDNALLQAISPYRQFVVTRPADKIPLRAVDLNLASVTNPQDWCSYEEAAAKVAVVEGLLLGFVLTDNDPFTVVDLDSHKTQDAAILQNHQAIYNDFNTYSERSPSGGVHLWLKGKAESRKFSSQHVEAYSIGRYMTVTLNHISNKPVAERQLQLDELIAQIDAAKPRHNNVGPIVDLPLTRSDEEVKAAAFNEYTTLFTELWEGRWQQFPNYPSQSEADLALCNMLAAHTDNQAQCARLFHASALGQRQKAKRPDYVQRLIDKSFDQKPRTIGSGILPVASQGWGKPSDSWTMPLVPTNSFFKSLAHGTGNDAVEIVTTEEIQMEHLTWLWPGFLPKGKLTLLAGQSGVGKSTIAFSFAATVSSGGPWPDNVRAEAGHVLIWSSEDDVADTILPRLVAMGANRRNVHILQSTQKNNQKKPFDPATDVPLLYQTIMSKGNRPSLLIVDPIVSAISGDSHKSNDVRRGLQNLVDMAGELDCAVLGITHFAKNSVGRNPVERIIGSQAFAAFARVNLVAAEDEESGNRVFCKAQTNIAKANGGFSYSIEVRPLDNNIIGTAIVWGGAIDGNAKTILGGVEDGDAGRDRKKQVQVAEEFLIKELREGPRSPKELAELAKNVYGIHEKALQRARVRLNIQAVKEGKDSWKWKLPLQR